MNLLYLLFSALEMFVLLYLFGCRAIATLRVVQMLLDVFDESVAWCCVFDDLFPAIWFVFCVDCMAKCLGILRECAL